MTPTLDPVFATAVEAALRNEVDAARGASRPWWRRHRKLAIALPLAALALGGASAATAAVLGAPGSVITATHGTPIIETHAGRATIALDSLPQGTSTLEVEIGCLSRGTVTVVGLTTITCDQSLVDAAATDGATEGGNMSADRTHLDVIATPGTQWTIRIAATDEDTVPWATNSHGQSYGLTNEHGRPDLIATTGTDPHGNPIAGYTHRADTPEAIPSPSAGAQTPPSRALDIPLYAVDGTTRIGTARIER
ncbi:hypothetical protein ACPEEZ_11320 [Frigoribacterium sp. 2-23]|uniref:hypothetical protein n=1 Tax=Frigoribacterium sp. 2-23 TaxID=3415006 RepID=UPI003C6FA575